MGDYHTFYSGTDNGLDSEYESSQADMIKTSSFGFSTDPRTANQLKMVSDKLSTGAKTVEMSTVTPQVFESIPTQHFEEINRLRKLVGAEITLHAPVIEPTGVTKQGWDPSQREQAERQMWTAIEQGHKIDPKGNVVITFHSSAGLPEPETRVIEEVEKDGKKQKEEVLKEFWVVDEKEGKFANFAPKISHLEKEKGIPNPLEVIKEESKKSWYSALQHVNFNTNQGAQALEHAFDFKKLLGREELQKLGLEEEKTSKEAISQIYKDYVEGKEMIKGIGPETKQVLVDHMRAIEHGDIYIRTAYNELKELYDKAYPVADDKDRAKLDAFREEIAPKLKNMEDPSKIGELSEGIQRGIHILRSINAPQTLKPLKEFAIDKAAETFSNLAIQSYDKFKDNAPIISIENPPAGGALSKGEDLKELIKAARKKFAEKAKKEFNMSESRANEYAEKIIGATWDVGHINMMRKFGYTKEDIIKQTKEIAPFVKHVHLSDNFGMEHTELPMGMGNVPTEKMLEIISEYNSKVKKIAEIGNWYEHFHTTPMPETLAYFNSPVYAMHNAPTWASAGEMAGSYFSGYGMNPEVHHATYGLGFSQLPSELGGQIGGRSRLSGAPME